VSEHYEVDVQSIEESPVAVLYRGQNGLTPVGPVSAAMTFKRVIHTKPVSRPEPNADLIVRRDWSIPGSTHSAVQSADTDDNEGGVNSLIRLRRTMIGSGFPVVKCGYSDIKKKKKEERSKSKKKKVKSN